MLWVYKLSSYGIPPYDDAGIVAKQFPKKKNVDHSVPSRLGTDEESNHQCSRCCTAYHSYAPQEVRRDYLSLHSHDFLCPQQQPNHLELLSWPDEKHRPGYAELPLRWTFLIWQIGQYDALLYYAPYLSGAVCQRSLLKHMREGLRRPLQGANLCTTVPSTSVMVATMNQAFNLCHGGNHVPSVIDMA